MHIIVIVHASGGPKALEPSCSRAKRTPQVDSSRRLLLVPHFRGGSRFESLIESRHFRFNVACECNKEEINEMMNKQRRTARPVYLSIYLFSYLSIHLSIYLSVSLSMYRSWYLSIFLCRPPPSPPSWAGLRRFISQNVFINQF